MRSRSAAVGLTQCRVSVMLLDFDFPFGRVTVSFVGASGGVLSTTTTFETVPISATLPAASRAKTPYDQVPVAAEASEQPGCAGAHTMLPPSEAAGATPPPVRRTTYPATPDSASPAAGQTRLTCPLASTCAVGAPPLVGAVLSKTTLND